MLLKIRDLKINHRLLLILAITISAFIGFTIFILGHFKSVLLEEKYDSTRNVVDTAYNIMTFYHELENTGKLNTAEAQQRAKNAIKIMRYQKTDYFWINNFTPAMVMHPIKPSLNGQDLTNFKDPAGTYLFQEMVKVVKNNGEGFVRYLWSKPGFDKPVPKISYVKGFTPWGWIIGSGIYLDDVDKAFRSLIYVALLTGGSLLLILTLLIYLIQKTIIDPLKDTVNVMQEIVAEGQIDLTKNLNIQGNDELTELMTRFNKFIERLLHLLKNVQQNARLIKDTSFNLENISNESKVISSEQRKETEHVKLTMEQLQSTISKIAASAEVAAQKTDEGNSLVIKSKHVVESTATNINLLSEQVQTTASAIKSLAEEADNIDKVLVVIRSIADQTNLLALNAAIEAARAGEQGRGFAVVADEVRTLAIKTGKSTEEIQTMIEKLQQGANSAVSVIENSASHSAETANNAAQANESLTEISNVIKDVNEIVSQVAYSVEQQSSAVIEMAKNANSISTLSQRSQDCIETSASSASEILKLGENLLSHTNHFKV